VLETRWTELLHRHLPAGHGSGRNRLLRIGPSRCNAWASTSLELKNWSVKGKGCGYSGVSQLGQLASKCPFIRFYPSYVGVSLCLSGTQLSV
jgi:hypothetical protein